MPNTSKNYYAALGLAPDAPETVIKAAYRALAKQYHPDSAGTKQAEVAAKFMEIQEAYEVLSDPEARREYDKRRTNVDADQLATANDQERHAHIDPDEIWDKAAAKDPEITRIHRDFRRMSIPLANRFRLAVINNECGDEPKDFAKRLERKFFRRYFSHSPKAQALAKRLLLAGHRDAARQLNKALNDGSLKTTTDRDKFLEELDRACFPDTQSEETKPKPKPSFQHGSTKSRDKRLSWGISTVALALIIVSGVGLSVALIRMMAADDLDAYRLAKTLYDRLVPLDDEDLKRQKVKTQTVYPNGSLSPKGTKKLFNERLSDKRGHTRSTAKTPKFGPVEQTTTTDGKGDRLPRTW